MDSNNPKKNIETLSKAELLAVAKERNLSGYHKLKKAELVNLLHNHDVESSQNTKAQPESFWAKYHNHIYGITSVVGLVLALIAFLPNQKKSNPNNNATSPNTELLDDYSIAVLPFEDMSPDKDQEYFGDGIAEEILNTLTKLTELKVTGRTSSFAFKSSKKTIQEIGQALNVKHVLEGSIRKQGHKVRITAQLINAIDGFHLWSETFDRDFADIFKIQDEVSINIGSMILGELAPNQIDRITNNANVDSRAYELYMEAKYIHNYLFYPLRLNRDFFKCEEMFKEAIDIEPNYALAHAGLADLYDTKRYILTDSTEMKYYEELKTKVIKTAMDLNPNLPYVQMTQGWVFLDRQITSPDIDGAFRSFKKAYDLDRRNTDGLSGLFWLYERFDLYDDCQGIMEKTMELNPNDFRTQEHKAQFLYDRGQFEEAIAICKEGLAFDPDFLGFYRYMAHSYFMTGQNDLAAQNYEQIKTLNPEYYENNSELRQFHLLAQDKIDEAKAMSSESLVFNWYTKNDEKLTELIISRFEQRKHNNVARDFSEYYTIQNHPYYDHIRDAPEFKETLDYQKKNYEAGKKRLPRATEFL